MTTPDIPSSVTSHNEINRLIHEPARFQVMALLYKWQDETNN